MTEDETQPKLEDAGTSQAEVNGYLDALRESGECNMMEGPVRLQGQFGLDKATSRAAWKVWTDSFEEKSAA